jgi:hypothetical protein
MKRTLSLIVIVVLASSVLAGAALAQDPPPIPQLPTPGTLVADGDGRAQVHGDGTVTVTAASAWLAIRDGNGDAVITIDGAGELIDDAALDAFTAQNDAALERVTNLRARLAEGWVLYRNFEGTATVSGSRISVAVTGEGVHLEAEGYGGYALRGEGTYTINGADAQWDAEASRGRLGVPATNSLRPVRQG